MSVTNINYNEIIYFTYLHFWY